MAISWIIGQQLLRATYSGENIVLRFSLPLVMKGFWVATFAHHVFCCTYCMYGQEKE